ncbi:prepilin-type N-terminal cleavage/methylation domain-containing protein [Ruoffia tabacinasalis]
MAGFTFIEMLIVLVIIAL